MNITDYLVFRKKLLSHYINQYEVPVGYFTSIPLPSFRFEKPSYVMFASPSKMSPGKPVQLDVPNRWWAFDAVSCHLLFFAHTSIMPFSGQNFTPLELEPSNRSLDEQEQLLFRLNGLLNLMCKQFFERATVDKVSQNSLHQTLDLLLPPSVLPVYQALAPDFFDWLK